MLFLVTTQLEYLYLGFSNICNFNKISAATEGSNYFLNRTNSSCLTNKEIKLTES